MNDSTLMINASLLSCNVMADLLQHLKDKGTSDADTVRLCLLISVQLLDGFYHSTKLHYPELLKEVMDAAHKYATEGGLSYESNIL